VSGQLAGQAAAAFLFGRTGALEDYAEEVADLFGPSLALALRRRRALVAAYAQGGAPDARKLRDCWIAYPQYWVRTDRNDDGCTPLNNNSEARETA
jgi:hypothetical protein